MRNVLGQSCRESQNTHFVFKIFFSESRIVYEIMWNNFVEPDRPQMTILRMRFACWITKPIDTHSEYVILMTFPWQQWLRERA
jgi:hypothetical protein